MTNDQGVITTAQDNLVSLQATEANDVQTAIAAVEVLAGN